MQPPKQGVDGWDQPGHDPGEWFNATRIRSSHRFPEVAMLGFAALGEFATGQGTRRGIIGNVIEWLIRMRRRARR
jgi:hypothetical protein